MSALLTYFTGGRMDIEQGLALFVFALAMSITPGPNNLMLTATGANIGVRRGLPHMFGIAGGLALMMFLVAAGAGAALLANPAIMGGLRVVGVAVLLWLAWKIATAGRSGAAARGSPIGFLEAAAFQWVNPKAWLMCTGAVAGFLQAGEASALPQAAFFAAIFLAAGLPSMMAWLGFGAAMQHLLQSDRALRIFNVAMGLLLVASVVLLL